jgi:hydrogenase maturation protease
LIIVDAVQADCEPGTVVRFGADDLAKPEREGISLHELGLYEALMMTEKLGCAPEEVIVFGVKPKEVGYGLELTKEIEKVVPDIVGLVLAEIDK